MYAQGTRGHDILAIFLVSIAHASSHFYHLVIPSLFPWILPHFGMNFLQGGTLMTTFFVTSAVGQSMSGFLVDKVGGRTSMYTGLVLLIASAVALGMAENVPMLYLSAMLAGAGNSVFHPSDYSLMNYNIRDRFLGHAFAWHNITGNIGWAICPFFMVTTAGLFGWRGAAFAASSVALIVLSSSLYLEAFSLEIPFVTLHRRLRKRKKRGLSDFCECRMYGTASCFSSLRLGPSAFFKAFRRRSSRMPIT